MFQSQSRHEANRPLMQEAMKEDPYRVDPWMTADGTMGFHLERDEALIAEEMAARAKEAVEDQELHERISDFNDTINGGSCWW